MQTTGDSSQHFNAMVPESKSNVCNEVEENQTASELIEGLFTSGTI